MAVFRKTFEPTLIYVYRINDDAHKGCLKIGETSFQEGLEYFSLAPNSKALNDVAKKRIYHQTQTVGVQFDLLHTEITAYIKEKELIVFQDHEVHTVLRNSGIKQIFFNEKHKANEWFYTDLETIKKAIAAIKEGRTSLSAHEVSKDKNPIIFRPEQRSAIDMAIKHFARKNSSKKVLWNAKMRFGKTLSALQVIKECNIKKTLILTHRPVVDKSWFDDYEKIFYDRSEFIYASKNTGENLANAEASQKS
ncbi:MAG: DEAD/DEAH box helicase family protein [Treponemataceae bacterium]